jgi:hypothetical protein
VSSPSAPTVHGTLAANTVTSVTLTGANGSVEVINRNGAAEIYFTVDGSTPTVAGNGTYPVPASIDSYVVQVGAANPTVALISSGAPTYSVVGGQQT